MMKDTKIFAQRLKQVRTQRGITQRELAQRIGMKAATVSSYENDEAGKGIMPSLENAVAIARELKVSLDYLCGIESSGTSTWEGKTDFFLKGLTMIHEVFRFGIRISEYEHPAAVAEAYEHKEEWSYIIFEQPPMKEFLKEWEAVWMLKERGMIDGVSYDIFIRGLCEKYVPIIMDVNLTVD